MRDEADGARRSRRFLIRMVQCAGAELTRVRQMEDKGRVLFNYANEKACAPRPLKSRCTKAGHRTVSRWEHEARLERMAAQVQAHPEKLAARKTIIEHGWGDTALAPAGRLFGQRAEESAGRSEPGDVGLQPETGAGRAGAGKTAGGGAENGPGDPGPGGAFHPRCFSHRL